MASSAGNVSKKSFGNKLVKGTSLTGFEPFAEYIVSRLFENFSGIETIKYDITIAKNYPGIYTNCGYLSICDIYPVKLYRFYDYVSSNFNIISKKDIFMHYVNIGLSLDHLFRLWIFDAWVGNKDRHWNNLDLMYINGVYLNGPALDFGSSLYLDLDLKEIDMSNNIGPYNCHSMFNSHIKQIEFVISSVKDMRLFSFSFKDVKNVLEKDCKEVLSILGYERSEFIEKFLGLRYNYFIKPFLK